MVQAISLQRRESSMLKTNADFKACKHTTDTTLLSSCSCHDLAQSISAVLH